MKTLPKILKGDIPLTVDLYHHFTGKLIDEEEAGKVNKMLVSVFNAGKDGISDPDLASNFEEFYKLYPRKMSPKAALKAYRTAMKEVDHETIMKGLRAQLPELMTKYNTDKSFVKHPATWLNQGCWADEVDGHEIITDRPTDNEMFTSEVGRKALKSIAGVTFKSFVYKHNRLPDDEELEEIINDPRNGGAYIYNESKKLRNQWKDK